MLIAPVLVHKRQQNERYTVILFAELAPMNSEQWSNQIWFAIDMARPMSFPFSWRFAIMGQNGF